MEDGILGTYNGVNITHEDLDLIDESVKFFVETSGYYISLDEQIDLRIRARKTLEKFGLEL